MFFVLYKHVNIITKVTEHQLLALRLITLTVMWNDVT